MANNLGQRATGYVPPTRQPAPTVQAKPMNIPTPAPSVPVSTWSTGPAAPAPAAPNAARGQLLHGLAPGGYSIQQLTEHPELAQKLGAPGAAKWAEYQQQHQGTPQVAVPPGVQAPQPQRAVTPASPEVYIANEPAQNPQAPRQPAPLPSVSVEDYQNAVERDRAMVAGNTGQPGFGGGGGMRFPRPMGQTPPIMAKPMVVPNQPTTEQPPAGGGPNAEQLKRMFPGLFAA
jgi:translation initiation factor IF-2